MIYTDLSLNKHLDSDSFMSTWTTKSVVDMGELSMSVINNYPIRQFDFLP